MQSQLHQVKSIPSGKFSDSFLIFHPFSRLCPDCSYKLNYHHKRKEVTKKAKKRKSSGRYKKKKNKKRRSREGDDPSSSSSSSESSEDEHVKAAREAKKEAENEKKASEIWKEPLQIEQEKSREENFDEFLEDLFMWRLLRKWYNNF